MLFYKYQKINQHTVDGLKEKKLWKSHPVSFNDPFELRLMQLNENEISEVKGLDKLRQENSHLAHLSDYEIFNIARNQLQDYLYSFKVISFTEKNDDILMWAHYAADHKGICLGFQNNDTINEGLYKVSYSDNYPMIDLEKIWNIEGLAKVLFNKSSHWSYEREWRKIAIKSNSSLSDYPGKLVEVILGARINEDDEKLIRQVVGDGETAIRKALLHPKKYELIIE